ncbi:hypothetical protein [Microlunatus sp. GCM10028923]|uniref:hypothetical protein n=1 Tax=Microlunatus sp. GCM10028923 TaxID=3273400 RepID=UPI0036200DC1
MQEIVLEVGQSGGARFKTIELAVAHARELKVQDPRTWIRIHIAPGVYYLRETLTIDPVLSGQPGMPTVIAGTGPGVRLVAGRRLRPFWEAVDGHILAARIPGPAFDQLFVDGLRQTRARYPNLPRAGARPFDAVAGDALDPQRTSGWTDPVGGIVHARHAHQWGSVFVPIMGTDDGMVELGPQLANNRPYDLNRQELYVENIREELDAPGEWYYDEADECLYYWPEDGTDAQSALFEAGGGTRAVQIAGSLRGPVHDVRLEGLRIEHAGQTFLEATEPLLRSDWMIARHAAVVVQNAHDVAVQRCEISQCGGTGVLLDGYARRVVVSGCRLYQLGGGGVYVFGRASSVRTPMYEYDHTARIADTDLIPGPRDIEYPEDCVIDDNLIHDVGLLELQSAGVSLSMASRISVSSNTIYRLPRSGINICDGTWGGHLIELNDVFQTVLETSDHGAFNSWGRDRFWDADPAETAERVRSVEGFASLDALVATTIRHNRFHCEHGWDIDLDDGSSNYLIYSNVLLAGGLKLREGYDRQVWNNVIIGNGVHLHVWLPNSRDRVERNILGTGHQPIRLRHLGDTIDHNLFAHLGDLSAARDLGVDRHSAAGSADFINPQAGDYRVREGSPALALGFENFPMNNFGVKSAGLRSRAESCPVPLPMTGTAERASTRELPQLPGLVLRSVTNQAEVSAHGLAAAVGVAVIAFPADSDFRDGDVILGLAAGEYTAERPIADVDQLGKILSSTPWLKQTRYVVWRNQARITVLHQHEQG